MMNPSESQVVFDTNILVYAMNTSAEQHMACVVLCNRARKGEINTWLTNQVLFEYFRVVTNTKLLTHPLSTADALADIEQFATIFPLLIPAADHVLRVSSLMQQSGLSRQYIFDVGLAATMLANGLNAIYTYDTDFSRIPGITVLTP